MPAPGHLPHCISCNKRLRTERERRNITANGKIGRKVSQVLGRQIPQYCRICHACRNRIEQGKPIVPVQPVQPAQPESQDIPKQYDTPFMRATKSRKKCIICSSPVKAKVSK